MKAAVTITAGFLSGMLGAMGLGGGGILLIYLTLFAGMDQLKAQGINLLFFIPIGTAATVIYAVKKKIKWKTVLIFAALGLLGSALGVFISGIIKKALLSKLFGGALVVFGAIGLFSKSKGTENSDNK